LIAIAVVLLGCSSGDELRTLQNDSTASLEIPGADVVEHTEEKGGTTLGKPVAARITRVYVPTDGTRDELLERARGTLEGLGWQLDQPAPGMGYGAAKIVGSNRIGLTLTTLAGDDESVVITTTLGPA